jgi:hypothetical protein
VQQVGADILIKETVHLLAFLVSAESVETKPTVLTCLRYRHRWDICSLLCGTNRLLGQADIVMTL